MRATIFVVSMCVGLFFLISFVLTFFAKRYITDLAKDFVITRTQRFAEPAVAVAEQALRAPGIKQVLDDDVIKTAQQEIADYRGDPRAYIARLVAGERPLVLPVAPARDEPIRERVLRWKVRIRDYFERTLNRLVWDLRIFSGSNLLAALIAACCALRAKERKVKWLIGVAGILLTSVVYGAYLYIDGFTYFRILFSTYLGWWYPVLLGITFIGLYLETGRRGLTPPNQPMQI